MTVQKGEGIPPYRYVFDKIAETNEVETDYCMLCNEQSELDSFLVKYVKVDVDSQQLVFEEQDDFEDIQCDQIIKKCKGCLKCINDEGVQVKTENPCNVFKTIKAGV